MELTKHFTLEEFTKSDKAIELGIDNTPNAEELENIKFVAEQLELIRNTYNQPINITSGYRCEELNNAVGGVPTSFHRQGLAVDINQGTKQRNHNLFNLIRRLKRIGLQVEELINEHCFSWIHIAFTKDFPHFEVLTTTTKEKKQQNA